jgi:glycosyltransferase involved in cell wall biosynthesis
MGLKKDISWFTPQAMDLGGDTWRSPGYTEVSLKLFEALKNEGQNVLWSAEGVPWHVNYCSPYYYQYTGKQNVGYTPWESTSLPAAWVERIDKCDQVWTTSQWCKEVFENNGVESAIEVVPHGISPEWRIEEREIADKFYFLHLGGDLTRKNVQLVVDAFLDLYDGDDGFHLILKASSAISLVLDDFDATNNHPQITIITRFLDEDSLVALYSNCHCFVYPTSGEGFGLSPFQAIATGMPTICTDLTGCTEYSGLSMPLDAKFVAEEEYYGDIEFTSVGHPQVAAPDTRHLRELMTDAVKNFPKHKAQAIRSARILHSMQSWDSIARRILDLLELS